MKYPVIWVNIYIIRYQIQVTYCALKILYCCWIQTQQIQIVQLETNVYKQNVYFHTLCTTAFMFLQGLDQPDQISPRVVLINMPT